MVLSYLRAEKITPYLSRDIIICGDDDVNLQLSHRGDMDDDGLHPADRPPFVCGLIYFSAVTTSAEDIYEQQNVNNGGVVSINDIQHGFSD